MGSEAVVVRKSTNTETASNPRTDGTKPKIKIVQDLLKEGFNEHSSEFKRTITAHNISEETIADVLLQRDIDAKRLKMALKSLPDLSPKSVERLKEKLTKEGSILSDYEYDNAERAESLGGAAGSRDGFVGNGTTGIEVLAVSGKLLTSVNAVRTGVGGATAFTAGKVIPVIGGILTAGDCLLDIGMASTCNADEKNEAWTKAAVNIGLTVGCAILFSGLIPIPGVGAAIGAWVGASIGNLAANFIAKPLIHSAFKGNSSGWGSWFGRA